MYIYNIPCLICYHSLPKTFEARARHIAADDEVGGTEVLPDDPRFAARSNEKFRSWTREVTAGKERSSKKCV